MLGIQKRLPKSRIFRFDNGEAYALHSVKAAIQIALKGNLVGAMKCLVRITYGNKGWPDLLLLHNGKMLGIEVKVKKDKQRATQISMESVFVLTGHQYVIIDDKDTLENQIEKIVCLIL